MAPNTTITADSAEDKVTDVHFEDRSFKAFHKLCTPLNGEDIVITGIAGKYPNSDNINQFRDNLFSKSDMISSDDRRWRPYPGIPQRTGKINDISSFDAGFFGIDRCHANLMDPIIRMLLERTFEAILDAGYNPSELQRKRVGVFIGCSFSETEKVMMYNQSTEKGQVPIGATFSMIPQSISYYFGLQGPSYISDSGCSSSLYVLAHAFRNIRNGNCDIALVGGANLCLHAVMSLQYVRLGVLSADGNCKTFDSSADGFVRSESVSVIMLQRSKDARRVYARVLHSKENSDGFKEEGFAFPSNEMQATLLKQTYQECGVNVSDVSYIEAHGTGTYVGDAQELTALTEVFCHKKRLRPLYIGSVKSNVGHTECTAGLTSIAKILISMENECIPGNRNYKHPRKDFEVLRMGQLKVVSEKTRWPDGNGLAGISSFGIGGANAHAVLRWNSKLKREARDELPRLVCVSGRCAEAIEAILDQLTKGPMDAEFIQLIHSIFGKDIANHPLRGYSLLSKTREIKRSIRNNSTCKSELVWVFNSHESNWFTVAKHLMVFSIFVEHLERIQKKTAINIADLIKSAKPLSVMEKVLGTVTVQISLGETLRSLGLEPESTIGLGTGEVIAAYFKNFLTLNEVIFICKTIGNMHSNGTSLIYKLLSQTVQSNHLFFNSDLTEYFKRNSRATFEARKEFLLENPTNLIIGAEIEGLERFSLVPRHSEHPINDFLSLLGTMYENGHSIQLVKLYPRIPWPVGRGTPMISPLIKWKRNQDWFVALKKDEKEVKYGQRVVHVVPKDPEWKFITGHIVDGRNLFPATGYLTMVWETFAKNVGKTASDMRIVFENVKFLRAVNMTGRDDVEMTILIRQSDNNFEVCESGFTLVTGQIYEMQDAQELTNLHIPAEECVEGVVTMTQDDVYKELGIRGYRFKGPFKGITKCDIGANKGLVTWKGNWTLFLDSVLQMKILHIDTRNLRVPTNIEQVIIDGPKQTRLLGGDLNKEADLPVYIHEELDLTRSEAVEFRKTVSQEVQRKKSGVQVLETYKFIPNKMALSSAESARVMMQMILENQPTVQKFKSIELTLEHLQPLSPHIKETIDGLPSVQAELIEFPENSNKLNTEKEALVVIIPDLTNNNEKLLKEALDAIKDTNGFIIARETSYFDTSSTTFLGLNILSVNTNKLETLVLLQQKSHDYKESIVIDVSPGLDDISWLTKTQEALRKGQNIVIFSQNKFVNGILGFVNCLRREMYYSRVSCFFIMDDAPKFDLKLAFYKDQAEKNLAINVWKDGKWGTYRHLKIDKNVSVQCEHSYVNVTMRGDLSSVKFIEGPLHKNDSMPLGKELIQVYYAGLNFRDIILTSGELPADAVTKNRAEQECLQGIEFVGKDKTGKRVMGIVYSKAISSYVAADSNLLWPIHEDWTFEDAATIPTAYFIAIYALIMKAKIRSGQSILIHECTGAVSQAALNIALHYNCNVFITTSRNKAHLRSNYPQIPESHIGDSRDTSFEQMIRVETKARGVDLVLNSLTQEKNLLASLRCLASNGCFIEVGRFNMNRNADLQIQGDITFCGVLIDMVFQLKADVKEKIYNHMTRLIENGAIKPLPRTIFEKSDVADAYKYLQSRRHFGKVLIRIYKEEEKKLEYQETTQGNPRYFCYPECSYVIIGGLGGIGLELADWLIIRGAKKLVLVSRTGLRGGYAASKIWLWKSYGVKVKIRTDDVTTEEGCKALINYANFLGTMKAIFNLAVVLKDALLENQTEESYITAFNPKAIATQYLDVLTRKMCPHLSDFVVFSSLACGRGNSGQTNYGMANSVMERICEQRKLDGYPALAIQWGAIGDVGIVADFQKTTDTEVTIAGTLQQRIANCLKVMDIFLRQNEPIVSSMVVAEKRNFNSASDIIDVVCNMLGVVDLNKISLHTTFPELGMDSMTSFEIKQVLQREYDIFLLEHEIKTMTFAKFKDLVETKMAARA